MNTLESLEFEIKPKSDTTKIDETITKMEKLNDTVEQNADAFKKLQSSTSTIRYNVVPGEMPIPKINDTRILDTSEVDRYRVAFESFMSDASSSTNRLKYAMDGVRLDSLVQQGERNKAILQQLNEHVHELHLGTQDVNSEMYRLSAPLSKTNSDVNKIKNSIDGVKNKTKSSTSAFNKFKNVVNTTKNSVDKVFGSSGIAKIKRFTLALLGARSAFTAVRKAVSSYLAYDTELSKQIQNDWAVLGSLLAPVLEYVINLFTKAVSIVATFIKALTGIDLVAKANAKALNNVAGAANSALKNLAKFDELNVVNNDNSKASGGLDTLTIDNIDISPYEALYKRIKEQDWYDIGYSIGEEINKGLYALDLSKYEKTISSYGTKIAKAFNGLVDGIDWEQLGKDIGVGLNIITDTINNFLETADFTNFGSSLGDSISTTISTIDWKKLGETAANLGTTPLDFLIGLFQNIDWAEFAKNVGTFITTTFNKFKDWLGKVDWIAVGESLCNFICDTVENLDVGEIVVSVILLLAKIKMALTDVLIGFVKGIVTRIYNDFKKENEGKDWKQIGLDCLLGFLKGITGISIITFVHNKLVKPLIDGLKKDLGIHSPSTVFFNLGSQTIQGFINGFGDIWEKVKTNITNFKNKAKSAFSDIGTTISQTFGDKIKSIFSSLIRGIIDKINGFINSINSAINYINKIPGVSIGKISQISYPQLATGTNMIEYEGLYHLHQGEAVVPKKYNPAMGGNTGSEEVAQRLDILINMLENTDFNNTVYVGNEKLYSGTVNYIRKKNNMYGTNAIRI